MTETLKIRLALQGLNDVSAGLNSIGARMRTVMSALPAIAATIAGSAIAQEFTRINDEMVKAGNTASTFGLSARFVSEFGYAFKVAGVEQAKFAEGMKGFLERAASQGRTVTDLSEALLEQADIFSRMADGPEKAQLAVKMFGEAGLAMVPVLNQGRDGLSAMAEEARRFGMSMDEDAVRAARALKMDIERLNAAFEGIKTSMVRDLTPAFSELSKVALSVLNLRSADGKSWLKQAADDAADSVGSFVRDYMDFKAFLDAYVPALIVTGSHQAAFNQGLDAANKLITQYDANLQSLKNPLKEVGDEARKTSQALVAAQNYPQRAAANASALLDIRTINARGGRMTEVDRRSEERAIAARRMQDLDRQAAALEATRPQDMGAFIGEDGRITRSEEAIAFEEKHIALMRERAMVQAEVNQLGASETSMVWSNTLIDLQNQWGSWSAQIAGTFAAVFNTSISTISSNLTGVIMQTKSWGQALANIGNTILTTVIQSIIEMGVRWVMTRAMVGIANILWSGKEAVAAAPKAMMESISSYGVAALLGGAAFAAIMAAVGGFATGGYTGDMPASQVAGVVHGREFVFSAPATQAIGVDTLEQMQATGSVPATGSGGGGREQRIVIVDDARTAADLKNDPEFENIVVSLMGRNAWRIRG